MNKLVQSIIQYRKIVILILVILTLFGFYSYYIIPKQENPNTAYPGAMITTVYPGASPENVESLVTKKIEDSISDLEGVDKIQSISMNSASIVIVLFEIDSESNKSSSEVRAAIDDVQPTLPDMCMESTLNTNLTEASGFIISLSGENYTQEDLVQYGVEMKSQLEKIQGISRVDIEGQLERKVDVVVDIDKLDLFDISIEDILMLLQSQNLSIPSGSIDYDTGKINVNTPATFSSLKDIENLVVGGSSTSIGFIKLKDIADISINYKDGYQYKQDGKSAILLSGYFEKNKNALIIGKDVRKILDSIKAQVPEDIIFHEVMYSPNDISNSVNGFVVNLIESILLVIFVVMIGVKVKNGLAVSISLPLSILSTFIIMNLLGIEFHFISIAALIISLGILVDNAIVISEAIQQNLDMGKGKKEAVLLAVKETATPVFTSTLTTVVTFGILISVPGAIGQIVRTIPIVVITSLVASYLVAMFIVPMFAYIFFDEHDESAKPQKDSTVKRLFIRVLDVGLKFKKSTIVIAFGTLFVAGLLALQLGITFFPNSDKEVIYINVKGETLNLRKTEKITEDIHLILNKYKEVLNYTTSIGKSLPRFFLTIPAEAPADNFAQIMLQLDLENSEKYKSNANIGEDLQRELDRNIVGANVEVKYLEYSMPMDAKIAIKIMGDAPKELKENSKAVKKALEGISGTTNTRDDSVTRSYEYVVHLDAEILSSMGLIKYDVVKQINTALMGAKISTYVSNGNEMDIVLSGNIESLDDLYRLPIKSSIMEAQVLLGQIAEINLQSTVPTINRYNKQRCITILSDVEKGYSSVGIELEFRNNYADKVISDGIDIEYVGELTNMMDLLSDLGGAVLAAIVVIYIILLFQFKNFKKLFIVLTSIPLSLIGCFLGLYIFKMELQAMALLGAVSLIGIVVNNGIILVEFMDVAREEGLGIEEACKRYVEMRYRPIILSTTTTCIGLIPLIISGDPM